ncbi:hypothetical protein F5050DRAFT_1715391 [Lentinula boryana]|uniref:Uncharacterized protein n=1 Tax=Lentinula boryana TaxID=40481 RepID=A0ABQ8Q0S6_9AGAR|nr:hypothetical protein F5050DRAFT_1715391 [Lentinula boryana]
MEDPQKLAFKLRLYTTANEIFENPRGSLFAFPYEKAKTRSIQTQCVLFRSNGNFGQGTIVIRYYTQDNFKKKFKNDFEMRIMRVDPGGIEVTHELENSQRMCTSVLCYTMQISRVVTGSGNIHKLFIAASAKEISWKLGIHEDAVREAAGRYGNRRHPERLHRRLQEEQLEQQREARNRVDN